MAETRSLERPLRALGLALLPGFVLYHLWEHWPITKDRDAVIDRLAARYDALPVWVEALLVVVPLVAHGVLGVIVWRRRGGDWASSPPVARYQLAAAAVLGAFLAWHLASLWWPVRVAGEGALQALHRTQAQLDTLPASLAYVLGLSALCVHFGAGLTAVLDGRAGPAPSRAASLIGLFAGLLLWLCGIQVLAAYVAGAPAW